MAKVKINATYGYSNIRPETLIKLVVTPITWQDRLKGFCYDMLYIFQIALAFTCFNVSFWMMGKLLS